MIDLQTFLMRWFFLCNLIRDVAEIQTLPHNPELSHQAHPAHPANLLPPSVRQEHQAVQPEYQDVGLHISDYHAEQIHHYPPHYYASPPKQCLNAEEDWRNHCLRGITSYQPGTQRRLVMDAMRSELVQQLGHYLSHVDLALQRIRQFGAKPDSCKQEKTDNASPLLPTESNESDPDADPQKTNDIQPQSEGSDHDPMIEHEGSEGDNDEHLDIVTKDDVDNSRRAMKQIRDCMPQLVSAVLKAPAPFDSNLLDPVKKLRQLIISRCQGDPSWGVELCWLLEAEVGRAWKSLFEHKQQTGKRLIIVMPADKAAVMATIGPKKREAFDLLQDAERVTAYGFPSDHEVLHQHEMRSSQSNRPTCGLPSSVSLLRCSHFGDTMQFIDRLTQISLDLKNVPAIHRDACLQDSLYDMNRRLRRRMVTRGEVSLDVEDNLGPYDWPEVNELTLDMLQHSVHFPLIANQGYWPSGSMGEPQEESTGGVMRVLNIVVPEARILASRERCPYLVRLEVVETGLEGSDARLYAAGARKLGVTVEEALKTRASSGSTSHKSQQSLGHCNIPLELVPSNSQWDTQVEGVTLSNNDARDDTFPRGGWQAEMEGADFIHANPYEAVRENEYQQLHQHMQGTRVSAIPRQDQFEERPSILTGEALLNRVFGQPWKEVCDEVRRTSPYGHVEGWRLASFILKAGEDIRREALVMQMISKFRDWFEEEIPVETRPFLRPYTIMCVGGDAGLLECLTDAKSVDEVKKKADGFISLRDFFERAYGPPAHMRPMPQMAAPPGSLTFEQAQDNFLRSLVGNSLVCYVLQIKDRHNANILLDRDGHIMHIDFGFVLGDTPRMGKVPIFSERAPFKLSNEFWEVLGGWNFAKGGLGVRFCKMFEEAFACASTHSEELASLVEGIMLTLNDNPAEAKINAQRVRSRLRMRGAPNSPQQKAFIVDLVNTALTSWGTSTYDWLQKNMNGYQ